METHLTIYAKIENPLLAFFVKVFGPFIGGLVDAKITRALAVVQQVSKAMVRDPQDTYRRFAEFDELSSEDLGMLRTLMQLPESSPATGEP
ncbi:MAG: hypothetical protein ACE5JD_16700 [Candidatus Methylomirabilia bacterium]